MNRTIIISQVRLKECTRMEKWRRKRETGDLMRKVEIMEEIQKGVCL